jgi:uncharacterized membrane protein YbhN (UPF0104 family)
LKKYIISFLKFAVSLGLGVGLIVWFMSLMSDSDKQHVIEDIKRANYFWVCVPLVLGLVSNASRAQRWRILLRPLGHNPGFVNTFFSVMIMYFLNLFFPRLGEVSRCGILARYENVPLDKAIGTMVLERLVDVLCLGLLVVILAASEYHKFIELFDAIWMHPEKTIGPQFAETVAKYQLSPTFKYSVFGLVFVLIAGFILFQVRKNGMEVIINSVKKRVFGLWQGLISIKDVKQPFGFLFHTSVIWVTYFGMAYFNFYMFPETSHLGLFVAGICLLASGVSYSLTPGGLGLYPILIRAVLVSFGVTGSAAISMGWVAWSAQTASVLVVGVLSLLILAIINREPSLDEVTLKT